MPGTLPTVLARPPSIGGTVVSVDDAAARRLPGVVAVATIPTGVAVVAETFGQAMAARDALKVTWGKGTIDDLSDAEIERKLHAATPPFGPLVLLNTHVTVRPAWPRVVADRHRGTRR